uniref:Complement receptor type 1-like n=1 Tax=Poecilia reticulata TaxID=8081 RepID=A0A3P9NH90_POERE
METFDHFSRSVLGQKGLVPSFNLIHLRGCDAPLIVSGSNANLADKYITMTSFSSGDKVYYSCDVGHTPMGGSRIRTCDNGKWTPLKLRCERKLCGHAGEISNGQFTYTGVEFGDTATAVCNEGFILVGRATRYCMSNGWDGRPPVCEGECQEPTETNAQRRNVQEPPYTFRNVIRYWCPVGSLVGSREIWCTDNGTWSSPPPQCKGPIRCQSPNVPNAFWINSHKKTYRPMETISSFKCKSGYTFTGPAHITCGSEGQWLQRLPKCLPSKYSLLCVGKGSKSSKTQPGFKGAGKLRIQATAPPGGQRSDTNDGTRVAQHFYTTQTVTLNGKELEQTQ